MLSKKGVICIKGCHIGVVERREGGGDNRLGGSCGEYIVLAGGWVVLGCI